jgi:hypothetical protein
MNTPYQLVWRSCAEDPALAERFFVPDFRGELPFFTPDPVPASLTEEHLLKGLLTGLAEQDHAGRLCLRPKDQEALLRLVDIMRAGFSFEGVEELVLETSGQLRAQHGSRPAIAALSTGSLLAPASSKIKADLILDLWAVGHQVETAGDSNTAMALRAQIPPLFGALDSVSVPPGTFEACCYFTLASRHLAGAFVEEGSLEDFLVESVIEHVKHPQLKAKVQAITDAEKAGERLALDAVHAE